jgi:valyl-tRNA synthetase
MNLADFSDQPFDRAKLRLEDRWILSRLTDTVTQTTAALEGYRFHDCVETIYNFLWSDFCDWYLEVTKPRMKDAATRGIPQRILAYALDRLLRVLHPFVPHITETLWQHLNALVPDRSLDAQAPAPAAEACTIAAWPEAVESFRDSEAETDFALVQATIRAIRNIRARMNIPPRTPLEALIKAPGDAAQRINASADTIAHLAALEKVEADPVAEKPHAAATEIIESLQVYVPLEGVIDLAVERERLKKRIAEQRKFETNSGRKLSNENFVSRAKAEVVQAERDRLEKVKAELAVLLANLKDLE